MYLRNHIAHRFLTDAKMTDEILKVKYPQDFALAKVAHDATTPEGKRALFEINQGEAGRRLELLYQLACVPLAAPHLPHHAFFITDTVINNLKHIKCDRKANGHFDWTVFKNVPEGKTTFIFNGDWLLRMQMRDGIIAFLELENNSKTKFVFLFADRLDQTVIDPLFEREDMRECEEQFYKLLLFFYFSQPETRIVEGGKRYGAKKQPDGLDNSINLPITIVNCNWNITSVRLTGFDVAGHMRMQVCGPGNKDHKLIFVQPYKKNGYVRKATKPELA